MCFSWIFGDNFFEILFRGLTHKNTAVSYGFIDLIGKRRVMFSEKSVE